MTDVTAGHKQVVRADDCGFSLSVRAVNGDVFSKSVARTDDRLGGISGVAGILRRIANDASGMQDVRLSQFGFSCEVNVGADPTMIAYFDFPVNYGARADEDPFTKFNFGANDCRGMNHKRAGNEINLFANVSHFSKGVKVVGSFLASASDDDVVEDFDLEQPPRTHDVLGNAEVVLGRGWIAAWMIVR